jgi:hypothetical protein
MKFLSSEFTFKLVGTDNKQNKYCVTCTVCVWVCVCVRAHVHDEMCKGILGYTGKSKGENCNVLHWVGRIGFIEEVKFNQSLEDQKLAIRRKGEKEHSWPHEQLKWRLVGSADRLLRVYRQHRSQRRYQGPWPGGVRIELLFAEMRSSR